ncbi:MAG: prephenate dehydratase [Candidatus Brocadiia bacterium]
MKIEQLRSRIDAIDRRIISLLNRRAQMAMKVGEIKHREGAPIFAPEREEQVLRRAEAYTADHGVIEPETMRAIYSEIISACRSAERRLTVAFLGPRGSFSHHAARSAHWATIGGSAVKRRFGSSVDLLPVNGIEAVFAEVATARADYGVVPIENTSEGGIGATLDMFMESDLKVSGEILVQVHHALLARCAPRAIRRIYSKAEVLGQCKRWLASHYADATLTEVASTSHAAELASRTRDAAAVAHEEAAAIYGLNVLHRTIEDNPSNMTRFYVIAQRGVPPSGRDKTSILCFIKDQAGALHRILFPFWRAHVSLTKIESWPSKRKAWDYAFFIDFEGHCDDPKIARLLDRVHAQCSEMKILGSFPAAR